LGILRGAKKTYLSRKKELFECTSQFHVDYDPQFSSVQFSSLNYDPFFTHVHMYGLQRERVSIESILISVLRGNQEATRNSMLVLLVPARLRVTGAESVEKTYLPIYEQNERSRRY
jgi:hypothetical protein